MAKKPYKRSKTGIQRGTTKKTLTKREQTQSSSGASSWLSKDVFITFARCVSLLESLKDFIRDNWTDFF